MKTAIVTGCAGQVGSYMVDFLLKQDYRVIGLKRRSASGSNWRLENALYNDDFTLAEGDLTDYSSVLNLIDFYKPDEIYNFAAQSHVKTSFDQPSLTFDVNTKGVLNILESMKFLKSRAKLYQSSTSELYGTSVGHLQIGPETYKKVQRENTPFCPVSPYAVSKLAAHNLIKLYREAYNIWAVAGIMFNTESPRRHIGFVTRKITNHFYKLKGLHHNKLKLGNIDSFRDWSYAPEAVEAIYLMMQQNFPKEYVIGTGETHTIKDFLWEILRLKFNTSDIYNFVEIDNNLKRPCDVPYLCADPSLIEKELGWKAQTKFKELVQIMCEQENGRE